tara:strand:- start:32127 stop:32411 length:285 start_codon:yes stop_codon:yes gene_type:complete
MAKIIAKLEGEKYLIEITQQEITRLRKLEVQGYITGCERFDIGYEFPITRNIDSFIDRINSCFSTNLFHNLQKELKDVLNTIESIEKENVKWRK